MTTGRSDEPQGAADEQRDPAGSDPGAPEAAGVDGDLGSDPSAVAGAAVDADLDALADVQRERDEYLELAQRARADFENFRKRAAGQVADAERRGKSGIARELVPVVDNLERALAAAPEDDPLRKGVEMVHADLTGVLERGGVEAYDPEGKPFDPSVHEALAKHSVEGAKSGTVVETVERGYRLDGQVIRPARVVVAE
jgi:molecular chaperone GrpE